MKMAHAMLRRALELVFTWGLIPLEFHDRAPKKKWPWHLPIQQSWNSDLGLSRDLRNPGDFSEKSVLIGLGWKFGDVNNTRSVILRVNVAATGLAILN